VVSSSGKGVVHVVTGSAVGQAQATPQSDHLLVSKSIGIGKVIQADNMPPRKRSRRGGKSVTTAV